MGASKKNLTGDHTEFSDLKYDNPTNDRGSTWNNAFQDLKLGANVEDYARVDGEELKTIANILSKQSSVLRVSIKCGRARVSTVDACVMILCESSLLCSLIQESLNEEKILQIVNQRLNRAFCKLKVLVDEPSEFVNSRRDTEKSEFLVFGEKPINSQSFDNFLEFKENKFALQVLMKLKQRGTICHLLLFGPSGNGKSHLCSAVYSACKSVGTTALMLHSNNFVAWFVQSAYKNSIQSMREKIFSFDLLILEDLDFLEGKEKSQKELAYILDYFLLNSKSVLITSQRNPFFKTFLIGELQSKLEAFIPCEIKSPSEESRLLILSKLTKGKVPLSCLKPIAEKLTGSFRQMVAVSQNIEIYSSLFRQNQLTELEISSILSRFCPVESECEYKFDSLLEALEKIYCISKDKILSPNKNQKAVKARGVLIVILRDYFKLSFCEISKILGLKDHSSSLKSYNKIKESRDFWKIKQDLRECLNYFCERSGQKF